MRLVLWKVLAKFSGQRGTDRDSIVLESVTVKPVFISVTFVEYVGAGVAFHASRSALSGS
jgi:hypothetical protein